MHVAIAQNALLQHASAILAAEAMAALAIAVVIAQAELPGMLLDMHIKLAFSLWCHQN